jgi:5'-deoxynucleotidase YfbR-like HD superfamily hydrolase
MDFVTVYHAARTQRFHTVADYSGGVRQNLAEHSWGVAMLAAELWSRAHGTFPSGQLLSVCIMHDIVEGWLGDQPSPTKWKCPELHSALNRVERLMRDNLNIHLELNSEELLVLRWADALELMMYTSARTREPGYREIYDKLYANMRTWEPFAPGLDMMETIVASVGRTHWEDNVYDTVFNFTEEPADVRS